MNIFKGLLTALAIVFISFVSSLFGVDEVENKCFYFKNKADFMEVVRCKDCTNWTNCQTCEEFTTERLPGGGSRTFITAPDFFCGYGKREVIE